MGFAWTLVVLVVALAITWRYLGSYMAAVFDGRVHFLGWAERPVYRALGTGPEQEQNWKRYATSLIIFSAVAMGITYLLIRIQGSLPLNPQGLDAPHQALTFNTAASFLTNTNWQNYGGETTMSYFSQMGALTFQQFVSPAIGIAAAIAMVRGFSRRNSPTIGNFWVDMTRALLYIFFPIAFVFGIIIVGQGAVQTLAGTITIHDAINGVTQTIARGPIGSMQSIMQLGNNGGGFLNGNQATPFESPTGFTAWLDIYLLSGHPLRPHLHLRQDGGQRPPRRRPARGHGHHLRRVGGRGQHRRAPAEPGGGRRRRPRQCGQHRGQGGALRRHHHRPVRRGVHPDVDRLGRRRPTTRSPRWAASS